MRPNEQYAICTSRVFRVSIAIHCTGVSGALIHSFFLGRERCPGEGWECMIICAPGSGLFLLAGYKIYNIVFLVGSGRISLALTFTL